MRLTLRTMLAYQDELLDPADAEQLAAKIEESEFATQLMQRTQDVMRQLRLSAPKPLGKGIGLDPNSVAEYLDNTLPAERVAEFEKMCLESEMHLAEVSACHQILALVLGEPADVDPEARRAMYSLPSQLDAPVAPRSRAADHHDDDADHEVDEKPQPARRAPPEVPDYLREPDRWPKLIPVAAVSLLLALLAAAIFMAADPLDWRGPLAQNSEDASDLPDANSAAPVIGEEPADAAAERPAGTPPLVDVSPIPAPLPDNAPPVPAPDDAAPPVPPADDAAAPSQAPPPPGPADEVPAPSDAVPAVAASPVPPVPGDEAPAATPDAAPVTPAAETGGGLGRLVTNNSILLKHDGVNNGWVRMPGNELVSAGDRLLSLPTFRSILTLQTGVTLTVVGPTLIELGSPEGQSGPAITLHYGRITMLNLGQPNTKLRLKMLNREGILTFNDAEASVAAEIQPVLPPGQNPETTPAPRLVDLYAIDGRLTWQELPATEGRVIQSPEHWTLVGGGEPETGPNVVMPPWIALDDTPAIDRRASQHIADYVKLDEDVKKSLIEISVHRLKENRSLAARCLAQIDEFDAAIDALNDRDQSAFGSWSAVIRSLRSALARDEVTAAKVREACEKRRGDSGVALFRMLWGYTPDQLRDGQAATLVQFLDHMDLDFRVLAVSNLQDIVGSSLRYRPETSSVERKPYVQAWQRKLDAGEIVPKPAAG